MQAWKAQLTMRENVRNPDGFVLASLIFGAAALMAWRWWPNMAIISAVIACGYGMVVFGGQRRIAAGVGIVMAIVGLSLALTTLFLGWP